MVVGGGFINVVVCSDKEKPLISLTDQCFFHTVLLFILNHSLNKVTLWSPRSKMQKNDTKLFFFCLYFPLLQHFFTVPKYEGSFCIYVYLMFIFCLLGQKSKYLFWPRKLIWPKDRIFKTLKKIFLKFDVNFSIPYKRWKATKI